MVDHDVDLVSIKTDEIMLIQNGTYKPKGFAFQGVAKQKSPQLMIKILNRAFPGHPENNPQVRLEIPEYKDARDWPKGRSFGLAKRLVIPSFSVEPCFKMMLFPHVKGDEKPIITWNNERSKVTIAWMDQVDVISFSMDENGRTRYKISRDGKVIASV
jgi:hypothetical protein